MGGHGVGFVRRDGKKLLFITCKTRHLFLAGRKALDHRWTKTWRRAHKKESILRDTKKSKNKRTLKSERGIEGLSLQELLRKKNESAEARKKGAEKKKVARPGGKPGAKKKADLNARLKELRKKRKVKEEESQKSVQAKNVDEAKKAGKKSQDKKGGKGKNNKNKGKGKKNK